MLLNHTHLTPQNNASYFTKIEFETGFFYLKRSYCSKIVPIKYCMNSWRIVSSLDKLALYPNLCIRLYTHKCYRSHGTMTPFRWKFDAFEIVLCKISTHISCAHMVTVATYARRTYQETCGVESESRCIFFPNTSLIFKRACILFQRYLAFLKEKNKQIVQDFFLKLP